MHLLHYTDSIYISSQLQPSFSRKLFPSAIFYWHLVSTVVRAARLAKRSNYDGVSWAKSSYKLLREIENIGMRIEITGIEHLEDLKQPVVIIGNHMSMMETMLLPSIIQPLMDVTFVVKKSLLDYPVFKYVMRSRNPVAVGRENPREDFKAVMSEGGDRLNRGVSVIVFPQTTRSQIFDPQQMSSIGVKLAKKTGVSVIPLALKTDGWQNGRVLKDFGRINTNKNIYFAFDKPLRVTGKGNEEQQIINDFITGKLKSWTD